MQIDTDMVTPFVSCCASVTVVFVIIKCFLIGHRFTHQRETARAACFWILKYQSRKMFSPELNTDEFH